jgi:hypothetical protein
MSEKRTMTDIAMKVYAIVMIALFCFVSLLIGDAGRNFVGLLFIIIGFIFTRFKEEVGTFFYSRQIDFIKNRSSVDKFIARTNWMGTTVLVTGILFLLISILLKIKDF